MLTEEQIKNRKIWTDALRSGGFPQARATLIQYREGKPAYCCLGVACTVVPGIKADLFNYYLDQDGLTALGLTHNNQLGLARLNDIGFTFTQIADLIDADNLPNGTYAALDESKFKKEEPKVEVKDETSNNTSN